MPQVRQAKRLVSCHMIGVTIGCGDYLEVARVSADRMEEMTQMPCVVVDKIFKGVPHVTWLKCFLIEHFPHEDSFLYFDADVICLKEWRPEKLFEDLQRSFCAIPNSLDEGSFSESLYCGIPFPFYYVNAGVLMFGREHKLIWDGAWRRQPRFGYLDWGENAALNAAIWESRMQIAHLPPHFNFMAHNGNVSVQEAIDGGVINYHACNLHTADGVREVQQRFGL